MMMISDFVSPAALPAAARSEIEALVDREAQAAACGRSSKLHDPDFQACVSDAVEQAGLWRAEVPFASAVGAQLNDALASARGVAAARKFRGGSDDNCQASVHILVEWLEDEPEGLTLESAARFAAFLKHALASWGKSSRDRRKIGQFVCDSEAEHLVEATALRLQLASAGAAPGSIEAALASHRSEKPRMKLNTILRHLRTVSMVIDGASDPTRGIFHSLHCARQFRVDARVAVRRQSGPSGARDGWGDHLEVLFQTPLFTRGPVNASKAVFWIPLICLHMDLRAEAMTWPLFLIRGSLELWVENCACARR